MKKVTFILSLVSLGLVDAGCEPGWFQFNGKCYWYSHEFLSWYDAQSSCHAHNARLAEIRDSSLNDFLKYVASTHQIDVWLGARDDIIEGYWQWSSNGQAMTFTDWKPGEPNSQDGPENCLELIAFNQFQWNDDDCHKKEYFICEK